MILFQLLEVLKKILKGLKKGNNSKISKNNNSKIWAKVQSIREALLSLSHFHLGIIRTPDYHLNPCSEKQRLQLLMLKLRLLQVKQGTLPFEKEMISLKSPRVSVKHIL